MPVILVVEDDQVMRKAIGTILNRGGYSVLNATNGREAMELLETASYDVVITDLMMPYANGLEVVNRIRSDQSRNAVGVIVVSAASNEDMVTEAFNLGADDYLKKPVAAGELVSRIRKLINRQAGEISGHLPDDMGDEGDPETDIAGQATEPSYLIAVSRYVHEQAASDAPPGTPAEDTTKPMKPTLATPAPEHSGRGMWHMEESVSQGPSGLLPTADSPDISAAATPPVPGIARNKGADDLMKQVVIILSVIALLVIGMLLYIAL